MTNHIPINGWLQITICNPHKGLLYQYLFIGLTFQCNMYLITFLIRGGLTPQSNTYLITSLLRGGLTPLSNTYLITSLIRGGLTPQSNTYLITETEATLILRLLKWVALEVNSSMMWSLYSINGIDLCLG